MTLQIATPALLFPAISLLFLAYTNRFLHLSALIRQLYRDWLEEKDERLLLQIGNLRRRLILIRWMQIMGALCLVICVLSMITIVADVQVIAIGSFVLALVLMGGSLCCLVYEIWISGGALSIMLKSLEEAQNEELQNEAERQR